MAANLSALLTASKALTSHLQRQDLPSVNLSLDQIEAQSRRLVARQPRAAADSGRGYAGSIMQVSSHYSSSLIIEIIFLPKPMSMHLPWQAPSLT
jgi:nuclear pore complex protein Nup93